jgi:pSer/pThr/pTyr-binding forkhead associated (FHA) protein
MRLGAISGPQTGRVVEVVEELSVGRDPACVLRLDDPKVSRRHATFAPAGPGIVIRDDGSLNGTWVNDGRIAGERALVAGDRVRIGGSEFLVDDEHGEHLAAAATAAAQPLAGRTVLVP